jgi:hypothetical protein
MNAFGTPVRLYLDEYHSGDLKAPRGLSAPRLSI